MTLVLLLFLALTASWTGPVQCEEQKETETPSEDFILATTTSITEGNAEDPENHENAGSGDYTTQGADNADLDHSARGNSGDDAETNSTAGTETNTEDMSTVIIPLVLTLIIITIIVCGVGIYCRRRTKVVDTKEDHYLDNEDHEKVPMPMFEDDIPSVMELEMEDLENWVTKGNC